MIAECDQVEGVSTALHVEHDQAEQGDHRAKREVDRQLHRCVAAVATAPDTDHDKGWDEREFVEEIKEEDIDAGEHPHQAALHNEEQHEVNLETLGARLDRVQAGGETDEGGQHEERERNAVEAKLQADADTVQAGGVTREKRVAVVLRGVAEVPPHMQRHEHGNRKGAVGEQHGPTLRQAERDGEGQRERSGDGNEQRIEGQWAHREN